MLQFRAEQSRVVNWSSITIGKIPPPLKHVVGLCLVGSLGGQGVRELAAVVKMYPVTQIRDISRTVLKNCKETHIVVGLLDSNTTTG